MDRVEFFNTGDGVKDKDYYSITGSRGGSGGDSVLYSKATGDDSTYQKGRLRVSVQIDLRDSGLTGGDPLSDLFGDEDNFVIVAEQP